MLSVVGLSYLLEVRVEFLLFFVLDNLLGKIESKLTMFYFVSLFKSSIRFKHVFIGYFSYISRFKAEVTLSFLRFVIVR